MTEENKPRLTGEPLDWAIARKQSGVSATAFAADIGVSVATLYTWENGSHAPTGLQRDAYAEALRRIERVTANGDA